LFNEKTDEDNISLLSKKLETTEYTKPINEASEIDRIIATIIEK